MERAVWPHSSLTESESTMQTMLKPFLHYPCVVDTPRGQVVGVLLEARARYGNIDSLLVQELSQLTGVSCIIRNWYTMKTLRSHT